MERTVLTINARTKGEAILALETMIEVVKRDYTKRDAVLREVIVKDGDPEKRVILN